MTSFCCWGKSWRRKWWPVLTMCRGWVDTDNGSRGYCDRVSACQGRLSCHVAITEYTHQPAVWRSQTRVPQFWHQWLMAPSHYAIIVSMSKLEQSTVCGQYVNGEVIKGRILQASTFLTTMSPSAWWGMTCEPGTTSVAILATALRQSQSSDQFCDVQSCDQGK